MAPKKASTKSATATKATTGKQNGTPKTTRSSRQVASKYFNDENDVEVDNENPKTGVKRKRAPAKKATKSKKLKAAEAKSEDDDEVADHVDNDEETSPAPKRKKAAAKTPRKTKKAKQEEEENEPKPDPTQFQTLKYLLSQEALDLCRPSEEARALAAEAPKKGYRTYAGSVFTPFEELLSAIILSRPISHSLGHRSIRTILNPPYEFTTPKAIRKAGMKKVHQSMFDARTQHKEKTAIGICKLADTVAEKLASEDDTSLEDVRKQCEHDVGKEGELLKSSIHGMGNTGLNIFFRRVQWLWTERFPFMDDRTETAAGALGLPDDAEDLFECIDAMWDLLDTDQFKGKDEEEQKRRAYVVLLERIIGAHLEKKVNKVLREAEKLPDDFEDGDEGDE